MAILLQYRHINKESRKMERNDLKHANQIKGLIDLFHIIMTFQYFSHDSIPL